MAIFDKFYECISNKDATTLKGLIIENQGNPDFNINTTLTGQTHGFEIPPACENTAPTSMTISEFTSLHLAAIIPIFVQSSH